MFKVPDDTLFRLLSAKANDPFKKAIMDAASLKTERVECVNPESDEADALFCIKGPRKALDAAHDRAALAMKSWIAELSEEALSLAGHEVAFLRD